MNRITDEMRNAFWANVTVEKTGNIIGLEDGIEAALALAPAESGEVVTDDNNAAKWRENVEAILSNGDPDVIRCHEGGGPESLIGSLVLTMMRTRNARNKAKSTPAAPSKMVELEAAIALIREEANKSNSPLGRSDSLALDRIRVILTSI